MDCLLFIFYHIYLGLIKQYYVNLYLIVIIVI